MIFEKLSRYSRHVQPGSRLAAAFAFLVSQDFSETPPGRIDQQSDAFYAIVQEYITKPAEQGRWEAHRRYIDVQFMIRGQERIFYAPIEQLQMGAYDSEKDFLPLVGSGSPLDLHSGFFVVFYPEDGHMPGLSIDSPGLVKKLVLKVLVS